MNIPIETGGGRIIVSHAVSDWDLITTLAEKLGMVAQRWMKNQEPRTTIYL